ncbi:MULTISPECIES: hypothetical protein [unclassified Bradyrhizobium]|uniref:hypothetical protein n=1 Tax=Bradyrhizobium sp. USDA 4541 TaxID=2817704 RepID=UPI0020A4DE1A|nr:hypothetical protein [Bradyrhizobium sp. USDA 4541]MCP1854239.1 hypothetical protein [Bradyrhizobium sp. USDA 4541]
MREVHGSLIDDIAQLEDAISVATSAVEAGRESVHIDTGMTIEQFNAAAAPIEQCQKVAWLRRGRVVDSSTVLSVSVPAACSARSASTR